MMLVRVAGAIVVAAFTVPIAFGLQTITKDAPLPSPANTTAPQLPPMFMTKPPKPKYPKEGKGISGWVRVECLVTSRGRARNCRVMTSEPAAVFDEAALKAMKSARFQSVEMKEPRLMTLRIIFEPK